MNRMHSLRTFIRSVLQEGRLDDIKLKYSNDVDKVDQLATGDVSGNFKYLAWMAKQAIEKHESVGTVIVAVGHFHRLSSKLAKKDINAYATLDDLLNAIDQASVTKSSSQKKGEAKQNAETIFTNDRFVIVVPHDQASACHYGQGSKWCIAATQSRNYYNSYAGSGIGFFFIIEKRLQPTDPMHKVALAFPLAPSHGRNPWSLLEIFDAGDRKITIQQLKAHYGDDWLTLRGVIHEKLQTYKQTKVQDQIQKMSDVEKLKAAYAEYMNSDIDDDLDDSVYDPVSVAEKTQDQEVCDFLLQILNQNYSLWAEIMHAYMRNPNVPESFLTKMSTKHDPELDSLDIVASVLLSFRNLEDDEDRADAIIEWERVLYADRLGEGSSNLLKKAGMAACVLAVQKMKDPHQIERVVANVQYVAWDRNLRNAVINNPHTPAEISDELFV